MRAVVLVGGEGTRLRPITDTMPKPLVPLVDRPILDHVLDHLVRHGVRDVVLSSSFLEEKFRPFIEARHHEPRIVWITEAEPLGTGGAIVNALEVLEDDGPFLALNGDILTDLDLTAMLATHRERGAAATISLARVEDARPFGLVPTEPDGRVLEFREKPADPMPGEINAGTYLLEPSALAGWERGRNVSIERGIFPALIAEGRPLYGFASDAYWIDLGTPERYLRATFDLLDGRVRGAAAYEAPFIESGDVHESGIVGRHVVASPNAHVATSATVENSVLLEGATVEDGAAVKGSILGWNSVVGARARVTDSVLGQGASVEAGADLEGGRVAAGERFSGV